MEGNSEAAGSVLSRLEAGLREAKTGDKVGAIVAVPAAVRRFPFPFFVNAILLRLADSFKHGDNVTRLIIVEAVGGVEEEWEKVVGVAEVCERIFGVSYSNDALARALTLRLLGTLAPVLSDRKNVHHLVATSLNAGDPQELAAALYATQRYAHYSPDFCREMYETMAELMTGLDAKPETKLELLRDTLSHFHAHPPTARKVVQFCREVVLEADPSEEMATAAVDCLYSLGARSPLVFAPVLFALLRVLRRRNPPQLKLAVFKFIINLLAGQSPQAWPLDAVRAVLAAAKGWQGPRGRAAALRLLRRLSAHPSALLWVSDLGPELLSVLRPLSMSTADSVALEASGILCNAAALVGGREEQLATAAVEAVALLLAGEPNPALLRHTQRTAAAAAALSVDSARVLLPLLQARLEAGEPTWATVLERVARAHPKVASVSRATIQNWEVAKSLNILTLW